MILHSDMNNFYASVEILYDPMLRDKPVAVAGDEEARHGIVLAKNDIAKRFGIRTGQVLWEARQQCPGLVCVPAHYERYLAFSAQARGIYTSYTDQVEPFGLDECWLDVTGSVGLFGEGPAIADDIRGRMKRELGLTVSIGVSFNKVFAKLGSDMKKPDATTVITPENYRDKAWRLPVSDLLYVGPATTRKLNQYGITTIGELAQANMDLLYWLLGKNGVMLHQFANGQDHSGVRRYYAVPLMKSVGNSTTAPRDLVSEDDVKITLMALCESVGARLREQNCLCSTVSVGIRDNRLLSYDRQAEQALRRNMYHNTQMMLKHYRDIVWALECFPEQVAEELDRPLKDLDALLSMVDTQLAMGNTRLEHRMLSIKQSRLLLDRNNDALTVLRQKPGNGEMMYNIIFQTFVTPDKLTHQEILYRLDISDRHYYRLRQQAVNILSIRLWTAPAGCLDAWLEILTLLEGN